MTDTLSAPERSERMRRVKSTNTEPERALRKMVWNLGYRYRKNLKSLPGKPDLAFPGRKRVIFMHGCFWHRHDCRAGRRMPKSRERFWTAKFASNIVRDTDVSERLAEMGWSALVIWECELRNMDMVSRRVTGFLNA